MNTESYIVETVCYRDKEYRVYLCDDGCIEAYEIRDGEEENGLGIYIPDIVIEIAIDKAIDDY